MSTESTHDDAEREFLAASVAVWREVDRLEAEGPYPGIPPETDLRQRERAAWERYRAVLDDSESAFCRFCDKATGSTYHLVGAVLGDDSENPYCCDDCWDERLR